MRRCVRSLLSGNIFLCFSRIVPRRIEHANRHFPGAVRDVREASSSKRLTCVRVHAAHLEHEF